MQCNCFWNFWSKTNRQIWVTVWFSLRFWFGKVYILIVKWLQNKNEKMCIKTLFLYQRPQRNMEAHALIWHAIYIHRLLLLLFKGSRLQSSYLCSELGDRMMKLQQWACTARGAHKCEKCLFAFSARQPFSCFLESIWPQGFTKLAKSVIFYCTSS